MKGENLVKYGANRTVKESDHEESPDRQSDLNAMTALVEDDVKPIELPQSKTDSLRPESMHQAVQ